MGSKSKEQFQKKSSLSIAMLLGMYAGIALATILPLFPLWIFLLLLLGCFLFTLYCKYPLLRVGMVACCGIVLGMSVCIAHRQHLDAAPLFALTGQEVQLRGLVCDAPDRRVDHTKLTLCVREFYWQKEWLPTEGTVLISLSKFQPVSYGDILEIQGTLDLPMEDEEFSYRTYLLKDGITHLMSRPHLTLIDTSQGHPLWQWTFQLRESIEQQINHRWHEPEASFLAGLLIGSRKGIPEDVLASFQTTGLTHIIAISGYNITLLIVIITSLFRPFSRRVQIGSSIIVIMLFTILVGASSAVVRASIMGILGLLALLFHQKNTILITILVSGILMLLGKPLLLLYDVGYQLSFLAVLGLLYIGPLLQRWTRWVPEIWGIKEGLLMTVSATVTTTPAILYHFGLFSVVSPLANILVAPFLPFAMLFGFLGLSVGLFCPPLGFVFHVLASWCLMLVIFFAKSMASLPYASVDVGQLSVWGVGCSYGGLLLLLWVCGASNNDTASRSRWSLPDRVAPTTAGASSGG